jgi:hypothetical protein
MNKHKLREIEGGVMDIREKAREIYNKLVIVENNPKEAYECDIDIIEDELRKYRKDK